ncbi:MAG TPA: prepilin peptidase [Galbitalea sp.]|nr:prepilin peptidase [Galbitalea sp.]
MASLVPIILAFTAILGLAIGSFLNVVVWRVPRQLSLVAPASACPSCGHSIRARDNVPVVSWLALGRKCRDCGEPISARYPLIEAGTAVFFVGVAFVLFELGMPGLARSIAPWALAAFLYLAAVSVALAAIDLDLKRLPDRIVLPSIVVGALLLAIATIGSSDWWMMGRALIGGAALFLFYFLIVIVYPRGMGFGDVKLAALLGLYLGWLGWGPLVVGAFAAFLAGGLFSIGLVIFRKASRKTAIPFGPWMLLGAWIGILFGTNISAGYLAIFGLS